MVKTVKMPGSDEKFLSKFEEVEGNCGNSGKVVLEDGLQENSLAKQDEKLQQTTIEKDTESYEENCNEFCNPLLRQILAALGPTLLTITGAMVAGFSAILLPQLNSEDSPIKITRNQESWIASMAALPMALGCIFSGWSMEQFGRIRANLIASVLSTLGWLFIYFANDVKYILIGRLITGFCLGASSPSTTAYLGEMSHPKYRGLFLSAQASGIAFGFFITHLLGTYLHWKTVAVIAAFSPAICVIAMLSVPESHVWFAKRGNVAKAKSAFYWFRGCNAESREELAKILEDAKKREAKRSCGELLSECSKGQFVKPFLIMNLFFITGQLTGNNAVIFYSIQIMQRTVPNLDKYASTLIVDALRVAMSVVGCVLAKKFRVRPLSMISGYGTALSLFCLGLFVSLSDSFPQNGFLQIVPLFGLMSYIIFIAVGLIPLRYAICGEIFPPTRGVGGGLSLCVNFLTFFLVVKTSPDLFDAVGTSGTFFVYAFIVLTGTSILYFVLPETKNKTLKDIEGYFTKGN